MKTRIRSAKSLRLKVLSAAVASCFAAEAALANPTGANVVHGTAAIHQAGNLLQITNSPSAIINWQSFSIGANEITRFLQQSSSSAVLNRVTTQNNPSQILGSLQSRLLDGVTTGGRVFLINPNGILFGAGAQIDVGGLVASTLNMSNEDFLAGRMRFTDGLGNSIVNQGSINTPAGGHVYLVGPAVTNSGIITSPQGEVVLAAGNTVELVNPGTPNLRVEITAPNNEALNLGQIMADSGRIGIYAGLINQSGVVQANTAVATEDGRVVLKATNSATLGPGSATTATGPLEIEAGGNVTVSGNVTSGPQTINATGGLLVQSGDFGNAQLVANGGQTINARFVEVTSPTTGFANISNNGSDDQIITTTGINANGEGLAVRGGGIAQIFQNAAGQRQVINVTNADRLSVDGTAGFAGIFATNNAQTISVTGGGANELVVGTAAGLGISHISGASQYVTAGLPGQSGSITITGPAQNFRFVGIRTFGGVGPQEQVISTSGPINIVGGSAPAQTISSGIFHNGTGPQEVSAGAITLQGGSLGSGNNAQINAGTASQRITVTAGDIALQSGLGGTNNATFLIGASQDISATGNVTFSGGSGSGSSSVIGSPSGVAHSLVLTAGGDVVLTGGSAVSTGALIGNTGTAPLQPTNIAINAGGDVILNGGTGAAARIGSSTTAPAAGGDISISAGESIQLNGAAQVARIRTLGNVTLQAGTTISEGPNGLIEANTLTATSNSGASLTGPNQLASFNAANMAMGDVALNNTSPLLTVTGVNQVPFGALTINQAGNLTLTGSVFSGPQTINATGSISVVPSSPAIVSASGAQNINAGGGLIVQGSAAGAAQLTASGGQAINAGFVEVTAAGGEASITNWGSGDQTITTTGMNLAGEGLVVRNLGEPAFAGIAQNAPGQAQFINIGNADKVTIDGAGPSATISASGGLQTLSVTGSGANAVNIGSAGALGASILVGGSQNIIAGTGNESGSITIIGSGANSSLAGFVSNGQQNVSTSGVLSVTGGSAPAQPTNFPAGIFHNGAGQQEISAAGITLVGGASGSGNSAQIAANTGNQVVTAGAGGITIAGGSNGVGNSAQIRQGRTGVPGGSQAISVNGSDIVLQGGAGGTNNNVGIFGASQDISVTGKVTITGGAGSGNSGIVGSLGGVATDLVLSAGGDIVLKSGDAANTGALIGNTGAAPLQPTNIAINSGGNVILDSGTGGQGRIGSSTSAPAAGGDISIQAAGDIQLNGTAQATRIRTLGNVTLNAGGSISEGPNGFVEANALTTTSNAGTSLTGPNQVASFNATNTTSGDIALSNTTPLLTVTGVNQVPSGALAINQSGDLTLMGTISSGPQTFNATGNIFVMPSSPAIVSASGAQTINAEGGLIVQSSAAGPAQLLASGGQTINAGFVEVTAQDAPAMISNNFSGDQVITTSGMNASGEGLALRGGIGGFASIGQNVAGGQQVINVSNADRVTIDGAGGNALIFENSGVQTLRISGIGANALNLGSAGALGSSRLSGGTQTITAGESGQQGSITIRGNPTGSGGPTNIESHPASVGSQTVSTSGMLTVLGGSATAGTNTAGVFSNVFSNSTGEQTINAEGITLQGGSSGSGNGAYINAHNGSQQITVGAGGITLIGGAAGANNHALLRQALDSGSQTITVNGGGIALHGGAGGTTNNAHILRAVTGVPSGSQTITVNGGGIALQGGAGGTNNGALVTSANQFITATGNVTLSGGPGSGNGSIIGSPNGVATNLVLSAGGDVLLTGGSAASTGALIGNTGAGPLQPTNIAINAGRDVILTGGTGGTNAGARIGSGISAPAAGGDISISAGESIQLNGAAQVARIRTLGNVTLSAGGTILEGPNGLIEAGALSTTSNSGTSLTGPNQVASFNATNAAGGDIVFNNSGNLLATASNTAPGGKITISNLSGDLSTSGPISASGGGSADVALTAGGAVNIAHAVMASGTGNVSLAGGAITVDDTSVVAGGSVAVNGASLDVKGVSAGALIEAGSGFDANLTGDLRVRSDSTGGAFGGWSAILAGNNPVNISAGNVAVAGGGNFGGFAAITGGPVAINTAGDISIAGGNGLGAFGLLSSYRDVNLTVGGNVQLDSGTGLGSFARVQTLLPGSTISIHFPNLSGGGYFVNDVEGRISQGLSGFFNGIRPARLGRSLIVTYGE